MKPIIFASVFATCLIANGPQKIVLDIGTKLPKHLIPKNNKSVIATNPSQFRPFITYKMDGIEYLIAYDASTLTIKYIQTTDKAFRSAEALSVGDYVGARFKHLEIYPGWEVRVPGDYFGWSYLVGFDSTLTMLNRESQKEIIIKTSDVSNDRSSLFKIIGFVKGGN